jgi:YVTN family beta-propeller protein
MRLAGLLVVIAVFAALISSALSGGPGNGGADPTSSTSSGRGQHGVPPPLDPHDVYAADRPGRLSPVVRRFPSRVYVPNSESNTVSVINPHTYKVIGQFPVGALPQHVVPSYDLKTLWVNNDDGNSLTPINPATGKPGRAVPVTDPYNLYFTPDGRYAIVVEERLQTLAFRDAHTMKLHRSISIPCSGVNHMDFTADGRYLLVSCEFDGKVVRVDVAREKVVGSMTLDPSGMPQDVKLSPDGKTFYVADMMAGGVWMVDASSMRKVGFIRTGAGAHGLYVSRDSKYLYVSDRSAGEVSVISFAARNVVHTWHIPGGSPDMGGVSADGRVLWLSGRYGGEVYAISTRNGHLLARIPVGSGPHGLCVYPQPGRYSLGHTGVFR